MRYALIASIVGLGNMHCSNDQGQPAIPQATPVSTAKVFAEELPTFIVLPGITKSVHTVELQARVEGWLQERHFEEGANVEKGDLLYKIDSSQYEAQLLQAEANVASAQAQVDFSKKELERNQPLFKSGAISAQSIDQLQTQFEQATAQLLAGEASVDLAQLNLGYCSMYSPISGRIGKTNVNVGTLVGPNTNSKLAEVIQLSPMYVEFYPPANRLSMIQNSLRQGEPMPIKLTITENESEGQPSISTSSMTIHEVTGSLVFVDNEIQSSTSTILARGEFVNTTDVLPGQYVEVKVQLELVQDAMMVPTKAVMQQPGTYFVWTISTDHKATIMPVTLGSILGNSQHVLDGVSVGDTVIVDGMKNLRSGQVVTVSNGTEATHEVEKDN